MTRLRMPDPRRLRARQSLPSLAAWLLLIGCGNAQPSSTSGLSQAELMDPKTCGSCHAEHYTEWSGSMHAYASDDPLFIALN
ncbi:MAG TPA: hypothetical protein VK745_14045, partial [Polyangiaceae bacterium]|nr:hypothetical protein [Polyangiaceae bacterium]